MYEEQSEESQYYTPEEAKAKKHAFAMAWLRDAFHPLEAAMSVERRSTHVAYIMSHWQHDAEVSAIMEAEVAEKGAKAKIPSKDEFAASLITEANTCRDKETKLDYLKLFASVMGYVEKPGLNATINNTVNNVKNNVLVLPVREKPEDIEAEIMESQRLLIMKSKP